MKSISKSAWKLLENYCFLIKGEDERGNGTGNTSCLSFLIWMWIVFWGVAAILWPRDKSKDWMFACWSWQGELTTKLSSWHKSEIRAGQLSLLMQKRIQCKSKVSCSAIAAVELNFLLDQFKALFRVCFLKSSLKSNFPLLLSFCKLRNIHIVMLPFHQSERINFFHLRLKTLTHKAYRISHISTVWVRSQVFYLC